MYFESLLDAVLGERQIFHIIECPVCGFEEIYYEHLVTKRLIGRACRQCNFVQKFDPLEIRNRPFTINHKNGNLTQIVSTNKEA